MTTLPFSYLPWLLVAAGVSTHIFFFNIGEKHLYPQRYFQVLCLTFLATVVLYAYNPVHPSTLITALLFTVWQVTLYLFGLYSSLVVYRLFLNPLNKIPGPYLARLTSLDYVFRVGPKKNAFQYLYRQHQKYGKFVRIGPNDISTTHPEAVEIIAGPKSKCIKAPWYSVDYPLLSMHLLRDRGGHDRRRRVWSPAFSDKALRGYEKRVQTYNNLLAQRIAENIGKPLNMATWFNWYSFDVMGDLAFSESFGMLKQSGSHWAIELLNEAMGALGFYFAPWMFRFLSWIPGVAADYQRFIRYCSDQIDKRMKLQGETKAPDIAQTLIDYHQRSKWTTAEEKTQRYMIQGDSRLIVVAGSDTTAVALTYLFYHIAVEKGLIDRLREEIDTLVPVGEEIEGVKLNHATLLNGTIDESLRLHPPIPSGFPRKTPPEGVDIGGVFIPGNTCIQIPQYALGRDPEIFPNPDEFIPERFSTKPELIKHKDAWHPFSIGPYSCIGKNLAYLEIRTLTAQLIRKFDVALAPGETGFKLLNEAEDHFTLAPGAIEITFTARQSDFL